MSFIFSYSTIILLTFNAEYNKYIVHNMNNTRHASAGLGRICAPRWVTLYEGVWW